MKHILTHYIIVRRDLPIGVVLAQTTHAAGESFYQYAIKYTHALINVEAHRTIAVVLGARNEHRLLKLERTLVMCGIPHVAVREPDEPWNGQLMSIGCLPGDRSVLSGLFRDFQSLRELDGC